MLIRLNGFYDILCGFSILGQIHIPILNRLHLDMIINNESNEIFKRYFAYWILTYGSIRLFSREKMLLKISYLIEALCILNEFYLFDIQKERAMFVILSSLTIGYLI